jgi:glycosyltransferase involved in cell wall biosynthesis
MLEMEPVEKYPVEIQDLHPPHDQQKTERSPQLIQTHIVKGTCGLRPEVRGKFLYLGEQKLWVRGVTYGTFRPDAAGNEFHNPDSVAADFARMVQNGINTVRIYTTPPRWLLDAAQRHGLFVMAGLPWEQHVTFLDGKNTVRCIEKRIKNMVRGISGHPAILCYVIGNEIPAPIVRWHGAKKIELFLKRLCSIVKEQDHTGLVTYVNYPTTEYLQLPFLDFSCFNVYLEERHRLEAYLYRLQNLSGDRPLLMGELGFDSGKNQDKKQAEVLEWQIRTAFHVGCAGVFVFSWTDEWYRGGYDIEDWNFGLTDRNRIPKPALETVRKAFTEVPFPHDIAWPRISVVVCSYNGAYTIRQCFEGLRRLDYPNYEVIVVNDGSTDATGAIATSYGYRVINTKNNGLSSARNTGFKAAEGEIIAFVDDDAYPDPDWLKYLAATFLTTDCAGVGGPNLAPSGDGQIADCVANSPGGPLNVLLSDQVAEHLPGCNMAFRKSCLEAIGGFDPLFRSAGDDVDLCWRIQQKGWWLAFSPGAMVWHHRRNSIRAYWKQQKGYGNAEALLEQKWPEKYNLYGHLAWAGRIYGKGFTQWLGWQKSRIYHGSWGSALFQSVYEREAGTLESLPLMPEWYMVNFVLLFFSFVGLYWKPLLTALPLLAITAGAPFAYVVKTVASATYTSKPSSRAGALKLRLITVLLHTVQPLARLYGRRQHGLASWRRRGGRRFAMPLRRRFTIWYERWLALNKRVELIETVLKDRGASVRRGGDYDRWDLEVIGGLLGRVRISTVVEEHGGGRQLMRLLLEPRCSTGGLVVILLFVTLFIGASVDRTWIACAIFATTALLLGSRAVHECGTVTAAILDSLEQLKEEGP